MNSIKFSIISTITLIIITSSLYGFELSKIFPILPIIIFIGAMPYLIKTYLKYTEIKSMEVVFPEFLRNISESQKSGITITQAITNSIKIDYGVFSKEVKKMAVQISWGIPLPNVLEKFSQRVKQSSFLKRSVAIILEAHRSGGDIAQVMERVAESSRMIKDLEAERKSKFNQQLLVMYAIYLIFIVIILSLNKILLPMFALSSGQDVGGVAISMGTIDPNFYRTIFQHMILIQAVFAGLIAGQVGEGSVVAGIKHSAIMLAIGSLAFVFFLAPQSIQITVESNYDIYPPNSLYSLEGFVLTTDRSPISGADVEINILDTSYQTTTDNFGLFSYEIILPSQTGLHEIKISAESKEGKGNHKLEVSVG